MRSTDEFGVVYQVLAHDPASPLVNKLHRLGLDYVVLLRYTYKTGLIPDTVDLDPWEIDYAREVRLFDCMELLK